MKIYARSIIPIILMSVMACAKTATDTEIRIEGQQAGDCTDRADNDADGDFDCDNCAAWVQATMPRPIVMLVLSVFRFIGFTCIQRM